MTFRFQVRIEVNNSGFQDGAIFVPSDLVSSYGEAFDVAKARLAEILGSVPFSLKSYVPVWAGR